MIHDALLSLFGLNSEQTAINDAAGTHSACGLSDVG
ncbi:MAG: hypothetical protein ACI9R8_001183, partial [Candidatus Paceibacteria bacterium]